MARKSRKKLFGAETEANEKKEPKKELEQIYNTAIYARLSVANETNEESIENQIAMITEYIENISDLKLFGIYSDYGNTGSDFSRPEFERMMDDIRSGKINCIVVKDLSRFGRNFVEVGNYIERIFPYLGIRFIAINDDFDTKYSSGNELTMIIKNFINEFYLKDISHKIKSTIETKYRNRVYFFSLPYGYIKDPLDKTKIIVDEKAAAIVRKIFEMRGDGMSYRTIVDWLNKNKVIIPMIYKKTNGLRIIDENISSFWRISTVISMLNNKMYIGCYVGKKAKKVSATGKKRIPTSESEQIIIENSHEPIISKELFDKVQNRVQSKKIKKSRSRCLTEKDKVFKGFITCGVCGKTMQIYKKGNGMIYCQCYNNFYHGNVVCKNNKIVKIFDIKKILFNFLNKIFKLNYNKYLFSDESLKYILSENKSAIKIEINDQILAFEKEKINTFEDYSKLQISEEEYKNKIKTINKKLNKLKNTLTLIRQNNSGIKIEEKTKIVKNFDIEDLNIDIIKIFVKKVKVYEDRSIEIIPNFNDFFGGMYD